MATLIQQKDIIFAIIAGIVPAMMWLGFWLQEGKRKKLSVGVVISTFIAGGLLAISLIKISPFIKAHIHTENIDEKLFIFAGIEEFAKFIVVFVLDFHSRYIKRPTDYAMYLMTGSLGFAGVENVLYLLSPGVRGNIIYMIETGTLRYLGSTILHSILAAILGLIIGMVFYKKRTTRIFFWMIGIVAVSILHTLFNYFMMKYETINGFLSLGILWVITLIVITLFEKVKAINH